MVLTREVMQCNANVLWNDSSSNLDVNKDGKLSVISKWNLIGRFWKWIRNFDGGVTEKIHQAVKETFETILEENNNKRLVYVRYYGRGLITIAFDPVATYSPQYPANYVASLIKDNPPFDKIQDIVDVADKVMQQKNQYPISKPSTHSLTDQRVLDFDA